MYPTYTSVAPTKRRPLDTFPLCAPLCRIEHVDSIIRRAMVNVMSAGASSVQKVSSQQDDVLGGQEVFDLALRESLASVDAGEGGHIGAGARLSADPSTCILWCAVALGALVRGAPLTQVRMIIISDREMCRLAAWCLNLIVVFGTPPRVLYDCLRGQVSEMWQERILLACLADACRSLLQQEQVGNVLCIPLRRASYTSEVAALVGVALTISILPNETVNAPFRPLL